MSQRGSAWVLTLNNYNDEELAKLEEVLQGDLVRYAIVGKEVGENGTPHLQGYIWFQNRYRLNGVKEVLGSDRYHLELAKGSPNSNFLYCSKENNFNEYGDLTLKDKKDRKGLRSDLTELKVALEENKSLVEISDEYFPLFTRHSRAIKEWKYLHMAKRDFKTEVFFLYGPTGTGKTKWAFEKAQEFGGGVFFIPDNTMKWFDGYQGEDNIIVDDITIEEKPSISMLLRVLDRYPLQVPIKGGFVSFIAKRVFITSNFKLCFIYSGYNNLDAVLRRVENIVSVPEPDVYVFEKTA